MNTGNRWDIFCKVIDNYGDIGVCWRLSQDLAVRGERVRLWVDDASALRWMAPEGHSQVEIRAWTTPLVTQGVPMGDILVESFGCDIAPEFVAAYAENTRASGKKGIWINLEYLSAEGYAQRCHGLPSPVMRGPGKGLVKHFFYPGFTAGTGGLIREPDLMDRQARFNRSDWLQQQGIASKGERLVSLFCYEPPALSQLLDLLAADRQPSRLLVTAGRATAAVDACIRDKNRLQPLWNKPKTLSFSYLPTLTQREFDHLLWACDLNFVRGEDSLVRAIWAAKPFVWQIYPQHDKAHHDKLEAFLEVMNAPPSLRAFHRAWNGLSEVKLPALTLTEWATAANKHCDLQQKYDDLVSQLIAFTKKNN